MYGHTLLYVFKYTSLCSPYALFKFFVFAHHQIRPQAIFTVNQQILAAIKFGVSQNKVIWRLLNLASPRGPSMQCTIDVYVGRDKY